MQDTLSCRAGYRTKDNAGQRRTAQDSAGQLAGHPVLHSFVWGTARAGPPTPFGLYNIIRSGVWGPGLDGMSGVRCRAGWAGCCLWPASLALYATLQAKRCDVIARDGHGTATCASLFLRGPRCRTTWPLLVAALMFSCLFPWRYIMTDSQSSCWRTGAGRCVEHEY